VGDGCIGVVCVGDGCVGDGCIGVVCVGDGCIGVVCVGDGCSSLVFSFFAFMESPSSKANRSYERTFGLTIKLFILFLIYT